MVGSPSQASQVIFWKTRKTHSNILYSDSRKCKRFMVCVFHFVVTYLCFMSLGPGAYRLSPIYVDVDIAQLQVLTFVVLSSRNELCDSSTTYVLNNDSTAAAWAWAVGRLAAHVQNADCRKQVGSWSGSSFSFSLPVGVGRTRGVGWQNQKLF